MALGVNYFLLFAVYGIVNTYLPVLLKSIGYGTGEVGILLGIFETAGVILPLFLSTAVDKNGKYGAVMIGLGVIMSVALLPFTFFPSFFIAAASLSLFSLGIKGLVPITDTFTSKQLGRDKKNYGKIRAVGSFGFVCITVFLHFSTVINGENTDSIILSVFISGMLYVFSLFIIPNIFVPVHNSGLNNDGKKKLFQTLFSKGNNEESFSKTFWFGLFLISFGFFGLVPSQKFFSLYAKEYLHLKSYAGLWALSAMAEIPVMFLSGKIIGKFGVEKLIPAALFSIGIRNLTYAVFPSLGGAVAAQLMHCLNYGLFHPTAVIFCASHAPKKAASLGMTMYSVVAAGLSYIIGSIAGGYIIQFAGYRALFIIFSFFPFIGMILYFFAAKNIFKSV
ncbi:MFS transporter [Treponema pedis]|uniref:Major facilitator superfamily protein n=1 Tax=Treponema pedis str. T A4 TaxID=1291379 RepID=S6A0J3_9SPIR|nr:MFS transporter [Treponema pedis]AGT44213.1 major facilitator superfamily protein [Treponema pedis str. T A4]